MDTQLNTALKSIAALATVATANAGMTLLSAPGHTGTALAAAVLLTAFGLVFAKYSMEIVMLPIAVLSFVFRLVLGGKAKPESKKGGSRMDALGRAWFAASYSIISGVFGLYAGSLAGGMGWFMSAAMFGAIGMVLALLMPKDLVWAEEGGDSNTTGPTEAGRADLEQARREGVPAVLFADKVAHRIVKAVTDSNGQDTRR